MRFEIKREPPPPGGDTTWSGPEELSGSGARASCSGLAGVCYRTGSLSVFDTWAADRERWGTGKEVGRELRYPQMAHGCQLKKTADWGRGCFLPCAQGWVGKRCGCSKLIGEATGRQVLVECKEEFFNRAL